MLLSACTSVFPDCAISSRLCFNCFKRIKINKYDQNRIFCFTHSKFHIYLSRRHFCAFLQRFWCVAVWETRQGGILQMFCAALIYSSFNAVSVSHCVFVLQPIKAVLRRKISCPRSPSPRCLSFRVKPGSKKWWHLCSVVQPCQVKPRNVCLAAGLPFSRVMQLTKPNCDFAFSSNCKNADNK